MAQIVYSLADYKFTYITSYGVVIPIQGNIDDGGLTFDFIEDKSNMTISADGIGWVHSLHAGKGATATLGLLKTSLINSLLMVQYNIQQETSALFGNDQIAVANVNTRDVFYAEGVAFKKVPQQKQGKDPGVNEWTFNIGKLSLQLGLGNI
jgi:hypothetical protein